jgi:hypothetical protein
MKKKLEVVQHLTMQGLLPNFIVMGRVLMWMKHEEGLTRRTFMSLRYALLADQEELAD